MAIHHQTTLAVIARVDPDFVINPAGKVDMGVIDVEENGSWERLNVHALGLVRYIGKGTEGLQKMRDKINGANEEVVMPVQVQWLVNPHSI